MPQIPMVDFSEYTDLYMSFLMKTDTPPLHCNYILCMCHGWVMGLEQTHCYPWQVLERVKCLVANFAFYFFFYFCMVHWSIHLVFVGVFFSNQASPGSLVTVFLIG